MVKIFHTLPSLWGPQVMHPMQHQVKLSFPNWFHRRRSDSALEKLQLYFFPMNKTASQKNMNLFSMFGQSIPECRMHTSPQLLPGQPITRGLGLFAIGLWAIGRWTGESRAVNSRQTSHRNRGVEGKPFFWNPNWGPRVALQKPFFWKWICITPKGKKSIPNRFFRRDGSRYVPAGWFTIPPTWDINHILKQDPLAIISWILSKIQICNQLRSKGSIPKYSLFQHIFKMRNDS